MAKLYAKNFANPILTSSFWFLLIKSSTIMAFFKGNMAYTVQSNPLTVSFLTQEPRKPPLHPFPI